MGIPFVVWDEQIKRGKWVGPAKENRDRSIRKKGPAKKKKIVK